MTTDFLQICDELAELGVPEEALRPVREWVHENEVARSGWCDSEDCPGSDAEATHVLPGNGTISRFHPACCPRALDGRQCHHPDHGGRCPATAPESGQRCDLLADDPHEGGHEARISDSSLVSWAR